MRSILIAVLLFLSSNAQGAVIVDVFERHDGVYFEGEGNLNLNTHVSRSPRTDSVWGGIAADIAIAIGPSEYTPMNWYRMPNWTGPDAIGIGTYVRADSGGGDVFGGAFAYPNLFVPDGYRSGGPLSGRMFFSNHTFETLGLTIGSYRWSWGSGSDTDTLTINVLPEPTTTALLLTGILAAVMRRAR